MIFEIEVNTCPRSVSSHQKTGRMTYLLQPLFSAQAPLQLAECTTESCQGKNLNHYASNEREGLETPSVDGNKVVFDEVDSRLMIILKDWHWMMEKEKRRRNWTKLI